MPECPTASRTVWLLLVIGLSAVAWPRPIAAAEEHSIGDPTWIDEIANAIKERCDLSESTIRAFAYPSCIVSVVLDPQLKKSWRVTLIILAVFFAILVRQALQAVREGQLTPLVFFVVVLFGTIWRYGGGNGGFGSLVGYSTHAFFSALAAGVLTFWTRYVLGLLPVAAVAGIVAGIVAALALQGDALSAEQLEWFSVAVGVVGGAWLFGRSVRKKRAGDGSAQAVSGQSGPLRSGGASSDGSGAASRSSQSDDG